MNTYSKHFWEHVDRRGPDDCWEWQASCYKNGYGQTSIKYADGSRSMGLAHRAAYELTYGPIFGNLNVCHSCDNPKCCNPRHLFLGTTRDNIDDKIAKGRAGGNYHRHEEHGGKVTWEIVREIRRRAQSGELQKDLALAFSLSLNWIGRIVRREVWIE